MFDPCSPVPGGLVVRAWSTPDGVSVRWPEGASRPLALSAAVEQFCRELADAGYPRGVGRADLPPGHPHRDDEAGRPPPWPTAGPDPAILIRYVELQVTDGVAARGLREPTAAERARGAAIGPGAAPAGAMIVHAFALTPELVEDPGHQAADPGRPWAEFCQALIDEAVRRRPD